MRTARIQCSLLVVVGISLTGCADRNELKDNVYLEKMDDGTFHLIFDKGTEYEWVYTHVDSLSVGDYYGFLFYAKSNGKAGKRWFNVGGAPEEFKKCHGNWYDGEFRKYRINEYLGGKALYKDLKPAAEIWDANN